MQLQSNQKIKHYGRPESEKLKESILKKLNEMDKKERELLFFKLYASILRYNAGKEPIDVLGVECFYNGLAIKCGTEHLFDKEKIETELQDFDSEKMAEEAYNASIKKGKEMRNKYGDKVSLLDDRILFHPLEIRAVSKSKIKLVFDDIRDKDSRKLYFKDFLFQGYVIASGPGMKFNNGVHENEVKPGQIVALDPKLFPQREGQMSQLESFEIGGEQLYECRRSHVKLIYNDR